MTSDLKSTKIGNSASVAPPKKLLAHLDAGIGQTLSVTQTQQRIEMRAPSSDFDTQVAAASEVMARRRHALRKLAK